jgi:hypothetical protein
MVLGRIFGPKRKEVAGDRRRLHNEELHNLHASPDMIRVSKSRRTRWVGHVARTREMKKAYTILIENLNGRDHLEELTLDGWIILEWISGR